MMNNRLPLISQAQFKKAVSEPHEWCKYYLDINNKKIWYVLLSGFEGNEGEFEGGEYLVRVELPDDFPSKPPSFYFMTPNGLYKPEEKVCISIGEFHADDYRAALGVFGFCTNLVSGLIGWRSMGGGINILTTKIKEKKKLAKESVEFNIKNNYKHLQLVMESYANYSAAWDLSKIPQPIKDKLGLVPKIPETVNSDQEEKK